MSNSITQFGCLLVNNPTLYDEVFSALDPYTKYRLRSLSKGCRQAIDHFDRRAFNISKHLSSFFLDPIAFRNIQQKTGTIIAGVSALEFLDRRHPGDDMDIIVHPGHAKEVGQWLLQQENYKFCHQNRTFEEVIRPDDRALLMVALSTPHTLFSKIGYTSVHRFDRCDEEGVVKTIWLYLSQYCPIHAILQLHSTCLMNFITAEKAYSLYPIATFANKQTLVTGCKPMGWNTMDELYEHLALDALHGMTTLEEENMFAAGVYRTVEDRYSWSIPLSMDGISDRSAINTRSEIIPSDPSIPNVWRLLEFSNGPFMDYRIATYPVFRYRYLTAHGAHTDMLRGFSEEQGRKANRSKQIDISNYREHTKAWQDYILEVIVHRFFTKRRLDKGRVLMQELIMEEDTDMVDSSKKRSGKRDWGMLVTGDLDAPFQEDINGQQHTKKNRKI